MDEHMNVLGKVENVLAWTSITRIEEASKILRFQKATIGFDAMINFNGFDKIHTKFVLEDMIHFLSLFSFWYVISNHLIYLTEWFLMTSRLRDALSSSFFIVFIEHLSLRIEIIRRDKYYHVRISESVKSEVIHVFHHWCRCYNVKSIFRIFFLEKLITLSHDLNNTELMITMDVSYKDYSHLQDGFIYFF